MALTLSLPPADNNLVRNPIVVQITSDSLVETAAMGHISYIQFTTATTLAGSHLTIEFSGIEVDMESQTSPITYDGLHFRVKLLAETLDEWLVKFAEDVAGNYQIGSNYTVSADTATDRVYFQAKAGGAEWNITYTATPGTSSATTTSTGVSEVLQENFRLFMLIEVLGGYLADPANPYVELEMELIDQDSGVFQSRLEEILRSFVRLNLPDMETAGIQAAIEHAMFFRLKYYEAYGNPIVEQFLYTSDDFFCAMHGAIGETAFPVTNFFTGYDANFRWLTWQKRTQRITRAQKEWLAFAHVKESGYADYRVKVHMYYTDGTDEVVYTYDTDYTTIFSDYSFLLVLYFDCSYDLLVDPIAALDVARYTVSIVDAADDAVLSEEFTFILEEELPTNTRYFLFENGLGWYDTLRTTGDRVDGAVVTGELLKKFLPADYQLSDGKYMMSGADARLKYTQSTGWLKGPEIARYLLLFFTSQAVYEILDGQLVPIVITRRDIRTTGDNERQWALEFEYMPAYDFIGRDSIVS